jgi:hypothetical protein
MLELNLKDMNLIIFPNWNQSRDMIFEELVKVCKTIINHPNTSVINLHTESINDRKVFFLIGIFTIT